MKRPTKSIRTLTLGIALALSAGLPALAEKPAHAGGGKHAQQEYKADKGGKHKGGGHDEPQRVTASGGERTSISVNLQIGGYFSDTQRRAVVAGAGLRRAARRAAALEAPHRQARRGPRRPAAP